MLDLGIPVVIKKNADSEISLLRLESQLHVGCVTLDEFLNLHVSSTTPPSYKLWWELSSNVKNLHRSHTKCPINVDNRFYYRLKAYCMIMTKRVIERIGKPLFNTCLQPLTSLNKSQQPDALMSGHSSPGDTGPKWPSAPCKVSARPQRLDSLGCDEKAAAGEARALGLIIIGYDYHPVQSTLSISPFL